MRKGNVASKLHNFLCNCLFCQKFNIGKKTRVFCLHSDHTIENLKSRSHGEFQAPTFVKSHGYTGNTVEKNVKLNILFDRYQEWSTKIYIYLNVRVRSFGVSWIRISDPRSVWIMVHQRNR